LNNKLKETMCILNKDALKHDSRNKTMGCPFSPKYEGPKDVANQYEGGIERLRREEQLCHNLCGEMFPLVKDSVLCPCYLYKKKEVKETFWKHYQEANQLGSNDRWATVRFSNVHSACVLMNPDETEEELIVRMENSIWGPPAEIRGISPTPWGKIHPED